MRIDGPQITGSFSIGNTTFPDVSALATTGSNTFVGNQVISGSIVSTTTTLISGSSQVLSGTGIFSSSAQLPSGIISGSSQLPTGIVSSSAQVIAYGVSTTGSNILQGNQTITGSLFISENLVVAGSSSIQHISSSVVNINDNIITVNALNPSVRFGGLAVIDSGSSPQVSGSMLFDSINNQWLFVHQNQGTVTSSVLLMGPETYNNLGNESYITTNRLVKSTGIEHLSDSNITDTGTKVSINSNTEVTGSLIGTSTAVFGSSVTATSFEVGNGQYFKARRSSSNLLIDLLGIESGTDNTRLLITGDLNIKNGSLSTLLNMTTTGAATFSSSVADYAATITNVQDSSQGLLVRATDNDTTLYLLNLQSSNGSTSQTWVDRFVVTKSGNVGIGTSSPASRLNIVGGTSNAGSTSTSDYSVIIQDPTSMVAGVGGSILLQGYKTSTSAIGNFAYVVGKKENGTAGNEAGYLALGTFDSAGIGYERMRITSTGAVSLTGPSISMDANPSYLSPPASLGYGLFPHSGVGLGVSSVANGISFWVGGTPAERARITANGLTFNGDTAAANALDDYEEGTWTPDIVFGSWSFGVRSGFYTKIGNLVTANLLIVWSANNSPSGDSFRITLPFTAFGSGNFRAPASIGYTAGVNFNTSRQLVAHVDMGQNYVSFQQLVSGGNPTGLTTGEISSTGEIQISVTYQV